MIDTSGLDAALQSLTTGAQAIATSGAVVVDMRRFSKLCVIPAGGATVTISKVDASNASAHDAASQSQITAMTTLTKDWDYYRLSVGGAGTARYTAT